MDAPTNTTCFIIILLKLHDIKFPGIESTVVIYYDIQTAHISVFSVCQMSFLTQTTTFTLVSPCLSTLLLVNYLT